MVGNVVSGRRTQFIVRRTAGQKSRVIRFDSTRRDIKCRKRRAFIGFERQLAAFFTQLNRLAFLHIFVPDLATGNHLGIVFFDFALFEGDEHIAGRVSDDIRLSRIAGRRIRERHSLVALDGVLRHFGNLRLDRVGRFIDAFDANRFANLVIERFELGFDIRVGSVVVSYLLRTNLGIQSIKILRRRISVHSAGLDVVSVRRAQVFIRRVAIDEARIVFRDRTVSGNLQLEGFATFFVGRDGDNAIGVQFIGVIFRKLSIIRRIGFLRACRHARERTRLTVSDINRLDIGKRGLTGSIFADKDLIAIFIDADNLGVFIESVIEFLEVRRHIDGSVILRGFLRTDVVARFRHADCTVESGEILCRRIVRRHIIRAGHRTEFGICLASRDESGIVLEDIPFRDSEVSNGISIIIYKRQIAISLAELNLLIRFRNLIPSRGLARTGSILDAFDRAVFTRFAGDGNRIDIRIQIVITDENLIVEIVRDSHDSRVFIDRFIQSREIRRRRRIFAYIVIARDRTEFLVSRVAGDELLIAGGNRALAGNLQLECCATFFIGRDGDNAVIAQFVGVIFRQLSIIRRIRFIRARRHIDDLAGRRSTADGNNILFRRFGIRTNRHRIFRACFGIVAKSRRSFCRRIRLPAIRRGIHATDYGFIICRAIPDKVNPVGRFSILFAITNDNGSARTNAGNLECLLVATRIRQICLNRDGPVIADFVCFVRNELIPDSCVFRGVTGRHVRNGTSGICRCTDGDGVVFHRHRVLTNGNGACMDHACAIAKGQAGCRRYRRAIAQGHSFFCDFADRGIGANGNSIVSGDEGSVC